MEARRNRSTTALLLLFSVCLMAGGARATTTWGFSGIVRTIGSGVTVFPAELTAEGVDAGAAINGHLILDETAPGSAISNGVAYGGAVVGGEMVVGNLVIPLFATGLANDLVVNIDAVVGEDVFSRILATADISDAGITSGFAGLELRDSAPADVITSSDFPLAPPALAGLDPFPVGTPPVVYTRAVFSTDVGLVNAEITSLTLVPGPGTALLPGLGLACALACGRDRRARSSG